MGLSPPDSVQAFVSALTAPNAQATEHARTLVALAQRALEAGQDEFFARCEAELVRQALPASVIAQLRQLRTRAISIAPLIDAPHTLRQTIAVAVQLREHVVTQCSCPEDGHRRIAALFETLLELPEDAIWSLPALFSDEALAALSDAHWYQLTRRFARWRTQMPAAAQNLRAQMPAHGEAAPSYVVFVLLSIPASVDDPNEEARVRQALAALPARQLVVDLGQGELACRALVLAGGAPRALVHELLYAAEHAQLSRAISAAVRMAGGHASTLRADIGPTAHGLVRVMLTTTVTHEALLSVEYSRARWPQLLAARAAALLSGAGIREVRRFTDAASFEAACQRALMRAHEFSRRAGTTRH